MQETIKKYSWIMDRSNPKFTILTRCFRIISWVKLGKTN